MRIDKKFIDSLNNMTLSADNFMAALKRYGQYDIHFTSNYLSTDNLKLLEIYEDNDELISINIDCDELSSHKSLKCRKFISMLKNCRNKYAHNNVYVTFVKTYEHIISYI